MVVDIRNCTCPKVVDMTACPGLATQDGLGVAGLVVAISDECHCISIELCDRRRWVEIGNPRTQTNSRRQLSAFTESLS